MSSSSSNARSNRSEGAAAAAASRPGYMERHVKPGLLDIDVRRRALVVNYEVEAKVLGNRGEVVKRDSKSHRKLLKLSTLNEHTDIRALARRIVAKSNLIHVSKISRVEDLLSRLQDMIADGGGASSPVDDGDDSRRRRTHESKRRAPDSEERDEGEEHVTMDMIGDVMDMMYDEDMKKKVKGARAVLKLVSRSNGNMEILLDNDPLLSSLSRVLREDYKRSMDLVLNITSVFYRFSRYSQMHAMILGKNIGGAMIKVIELELKRYQRRMDDMRAMEKNDDVDDTKRRGRGRRERSVDVDRERRKTANFVRKQDKVLHACAHTLLNLSEDLRVERKIVKRNIVTLLTKILPRENEHLVLLAVKFLAKLSTVAKNKDQMLDAKIVSILVDRLTSSSSAKTKIGESLALAILRLLLNLSLDARGRGAMIDHAIVPRLFTTLKRTIFRAATIRLLYTLSIEDRCKSMVSYVDGGMRIVLSLVVKFPRARIPPELGALATNLTFVRENCEKLANAANGKGLHMLVKRMCKHPQDASICSIVRNMSRWTHDARARGEAERGVESKTVFESKMTPSDRRHDGLWQHYVVGLLQLAKNIETMPSGQESLVHVLATLSNLTPSDLPPGETWASLIDRKDTLRLVHGILVGGGDGDVVQACVMFLSTIALDINCDALLSGSKIPRLLVELVDAQRHDAGILVQALFAIYRMLRLPSTRDVLLYSCGVVDTVCESLGSESSNVASAVEMVLDAAMNFDRRAAAERDGDTVSIDGKTRDAHDDDDDDDDRGKLWKRIRDRRFASHNSRWVDMVEEMDMDEGFVEEGKLYFDDESTVGDGSTAELEDIHAGNDLDLSMSWRSTEDAISPSSARGK